MSDPLYHQFSGDPWGPCSQCEHPAWHWLHMNGEGLFDPHRRAPEPCPYLTNRDPGDETEAK